ncbi:DUF1778 domain-containing protein [Crenothrix sp.]|uniref:type II toxin-antitoxin system TacA family antitoxin n=1 Tax=Crenothrix sp. TaxID=3100433 RepID=UPI00374DB151
MMSLFIEDERVIQLSERDWVWLLKRLENPPPPNAKLQAAMERYQQANTTRQIQL